MIGISYGAISQLFVASLDPPDLEAISPLSTIDSTATTLYPGGILNTGFAVPWAQERQQNAEPAGPNSGQSWANQRIQNGRHDLRGQPGAPRRGHRPDGQDRGQRALQPRGRRPAGPRHVRQEDQGPRLPGVPVGGRADGRALPGARPALHGHDLKWFTFTNGAHIDSLDPATFNRWYDFLELFVAHRRRS